MRRLMMVMVAFVLGLSISSGALEGAGDGTHTVNFACVTVPGDPDGWEFDLYLDGYVERDGTQIDFIDGFPGSPAAPFLMWHGNQEEPTKAGAYAKCVNTVLGVKYGLWVDGSLPAGAP